MSIVGGLQAVKTHRNEVSKKKSEGDEDLLKNGNTL